MGIAARAGFIKQIGVIDVTTDVIEVIDVIVRFGRGHPPRRGYMHPFPFKSGGGAAIRDGEVMSRAESAAHDPIVAYGAFAAEAAKRPGRRHFPT